jgi:hypothetical protein
VWKGDLASGFEEVMMGMALHTIAGCLVMGWFTRSHMGGNGCPKSELLGSVSVKTCNMDISICICF